MRAVRPKYLRPAPGRGASDQVSTTLQPRPAGIGLRLGAMSWINRRKAGRRWRVVLAARGFGFAEHDIEQAPGRNDASILPDRREVPQIAGHQIIGLGGRRAF